ncbi:MAG: hypothetical protein QE283_12725 [Rhodoferax sp.]|nr:hypothetical protein [Rhodoferax sp.]
MFLLATLWAAVLNLALLTAALAWTPAFWTDVGPWLQSLPWRTFGTELGALLQMRPADAGAVWALWLCVSAVLLLGAIGAYALLRMRAITATVAPLPTPEVAAMFGQLSSSLQGLQGFGDLDGDTDTPAPKAANPVPAAAALPSAHGSSALALVAAPEAAPAAIGASLQQIDPELRTSYDALLRELGSVPAPK